MERVVCAGTPACKGPAAASGVKKIPACPPVRRFLFLSALALMPTAVPGADAAEGFGGAWSTTYGDMTLKESGGKVAGTYLMGGAICEIEGRLDGESLVFSYREPDARGEGVFRLSTDGRSFEGEWRQQGQSAWNPWRGRRGRAGDRAPAFEGLWETAYGRMRLIQEGADVAGIYSGGSGIEGTVRGGTLTFRYTEPQAAGEGFFELSGGGDSLRGKWRKDGTEKWSSWDGERIKAMPGRSWLVVLERRWESSLAEREYSFGEMLRAFFTRTPLVQVRQRFFTDEESLILWLRETAFLAEPTVLLISSHGLPEGISVGQEGVVGPAPIAKALRFARNLRLLHLDACLTMKGTFPKEVLRQLGPFATFPVSGYSESVDWAASAVSDFMYLDLILSREHSPAAAGRELARLLPYTGALPVPAAPFGALGFRLVEPPPAP